MQQILGKTKAVKVSVNKQPLPTLYHSVSHMLCIPLRILLHVARTDQRQTLYEIDLACDIGNT